MPHLLAQPSCTSSSAPVCQGSLNPGFQPPCAVRARTHTSPASPCLSPAHQPHLPSAHHTSLPLNSSQSLSGGRGKHRGLLTRPSAGALDVMPTWTLDQIAGLLFGALMLASVLGAKQLDVYVARQQRRQLGLCEECGGIFEPSTCSEQQCPSKGKGTAPPQSQQEAQPQVEQQTKQVKR